MNRRRSPDYSELSSIALYAEIAVLGMLFAACFVFQWIGVWV